MALQRVADSILAADVGTAWTRVVLIDRVAGEYRFVAAGESPTTAAPPRNDLKVGLRLAIQQLEQATQRRFLDAAGNLVTPETADGSGIDLFVIATSAAPPLKVAVGGLVARLSVASARRAAQSTYSTVTHSFALDAAAGRWGSPQGMMGVVAALLNNWPDVVVLAGGTEGGAEGGLGELLDGLRLAIGAETSLPAPTLFYAGNSHLQNDVQKRMGEIPVLMAENLRPSYSQERLGVTARLLDQRYRLTQLARPEWQSWGQGAPVPTSAALTHVVNYLALSGSQRVLGVDIGAGSATLAATFADGSSQTAVRRDLALTAAEWLTASRTDQIAGWLAEELSLTEVQGLLLNMSLAPTQLPLDSGGLSILQAAARVILHEVWHDAAEVWQKTNSALLPPFDTILCCGRVFRDAPRPAQAMALLLDALQPVGICHLLRDRVGLAPVIGTLAEQDAILAAHLMTSQTFESLGVVVAPLGTARPGEEIMRFVLTQAEGTTEGAVEYGQSYRFPTSEPIELQLRPARQIDIGLGAGVGTTLTRAGDSVGIVIDARGRPLPTSGDVATRRVRSAEWNRYVGA